MARGELIGLCVCPECNFPDAEVRPDKSGAPYRFCPDCTAQYFSRGVPHKVKNLLSKIRQVAQQVTIKNSPPAANDEKPQPTTPAVPATPAAPAKAARKAFSMDDL